MEHFQKLQRRVCELELKESENEVVLKHLRDENVNLRLTAQAQDFLTNSADENQNTLESTELTNVKQELSESNARVAELLDQLESSKRENEELKLQIVEANGRGEQISNSHEVTENVTDVAVRELQTQLNDSKQKVAELEQTLSQCQRSKERADSNVAEFKKQLRGTIHRNVKLCNKSEWLQKEIQKLNECVEDKSRRVSEIFKLFDPAQRNEFVAYLCWQGMGKFSEKKYQDAVEFYLKAIEVEKSGRADAKRLSDAWGAISVCWNEMKDYEKALEALESAFQYSSPDLFFFYSRGMAFEELGYRAEAITSYKKVIELNPNDPCAEGALEALAELGEE